MLLLEKEKLQQRSVFLGSLQAEGGGYGTFVETSPNLSVQVVLRTTRKRVSAAINNYTPPDTSSRT